MAASFRHGLSTDGGGLVGGTLGGEPCVSASDSNRNPPLERVAKRPNGGSCLIRFETKFKMERRKRNERGTWRAHSGACGTATRLSRANLQKTCSQASIQVCPMGSDEHTAET